MLSQTVPAFPVENVVAATAFYAGRLGFTVVHLDEAGFAIVMRDTAEVHLWQADDQRWRDRPAGSAPVQSGAESFISGTASCRILTDDIDGLYSELRAASVLHPTDHGSPLGTEWGTREFAALDLDGNLLTFFQR